jgi:hypothetical protein
MKVHVESDRLPERNTMLHSMCKALATICELAFVVLSLLKYVVCFNLAYRNQSTMDNIYSYIGRR